MTTTAPHRLGARRGRRLAEAVCLALLLLAGSSCGSQESPADAAPALSARLERVDSAIEDGSYARAREALDSLVTETAQARVAGDISDEQADRILQAAAAVLEVLPAGGSEGTPEQPAERPTTDVTPSDEPLPEPLPDPPPEDGVEDDVDDDGEGEEGKDREDEEDRPDKPDKPGKPDKPEKGEDKDGKGE